MARPHVAMATSVATDGVQNGIGPAGQPLRQRMGGALALADFFAGDDFRLGDAATEVRRRSISRDVLADLRVLRDRAPNRVTGAEADRAGIATTGILVRRRRGCRDASDRGRRPDRAMSEQGAEDASDEGRAREDEGAGVSACLDDRRCREVLAYLESVVGWVPVARLAGEMVVRERRADPEQASDHWRDVEASLRHEILPALAEAGVIERDSDGQRVRYAPGDELGSRVRRALSRRPSGSGAHG